MIERCPICNSSRWMEVDPFGTVLKCCNPPCIWSRAKARVAPGKPVQGVQGVQGVQLTVQDLPILVRPPEKNCAWIHRHRLAQARATGRMPR